MMRFMSSLRSSQRGTQKVRVPRRRPPLRIVADDTTLTPYGGSAVVGELFRGLGLVEGLDRAVEGVTRARAFKQRRRGASAGQLLGAMAESMLVGGDAFNDLEDLRHDEAGAELRAVPEVPAASTAAQLARRLRPSHLRAAEAALAAAGDRLDRELGRDPAEPVTLDFDSTLVEVYGRRKPGASRAHSGQLACQPLLGVWAERGRVLSAELLSGSDSTRRDDPWRWCGARLRSFPPATATSRPASTRASTGSSCCGCCAARASASRSRCPAARRCGGRSSGSSRATGSRRSTSATPRWPRPTTRPMAGRPSCCAWWCAGWPSRPRAWRAIRAPAAARSRRSSCRWWAPARRRPPTATASACPTCPASPELVEHHHRARAQIEERIKDHKLGVSLARLPASDLSANRTWLLASSIALNLLAMLSDLAFGPDPDERLPRRRQAKHLRRMLLCVPARVIHHARQVILRLPAGIRWAQDFARAYANARGLSPPLSA